MLGHVGLSNPGRQKMDISNLYREILAALPCSISLAHADLIKNTDKQAMNYLRANIPQMPPNGLPGVLNISNNVCPF
jgi:hypothetical protein